MIVYNASPGAPNGGGETGFEQVCSEGVCYSDRLLLCFANIQTGSRISATLFQDRL